MGETVCQKCAGTGLPVGGPWCFFSVFGKVLEKSCFFTIFNNLFVLFVPIRWTFFFEAKKNTLIRHRFFDVFCKFMLVGSQIAKSNTPPFVFRGQAAEGSDARSHLRQGGLPTQAPEAWDLQTYKNNYRQIINIVI